MSGSARGVKLFYKAEYCDTLQSKEKRNWEHKACLNDRALRLLDHDVSVPQQAASEMGVTTYQHRLRKL